MIFHGLEQTRTVPVNQGKTIYKKREKYCYVHGWIDVFGCGGNAEWERLHLDCTISCSDVPVISQVSNKAAEIYAK